jgi:hypothetical protein
MLLHHRNLSSSLSLSLSLLFQIMQKWAELQKIQFCSKKSKKKKREDFLDVPIFFISIWLLSHDFQLVFFFLSKEVL